MLTCPSGHADAVQNFDRGDKKWKPKEIGPVIDQIARKTVLGIRAGCAATTPEKSVSAAKIVTMLGVITWETHRRQWRHTMINGYILLIVICIGLAAIVAKIGKI